MLDCSANSQTRKEQRCVVILGAGASAPYGIPMASELLSRADEMREEYPDFVRKIKKLAECFEGEKNLEDILTEVNNAFQIFSAITELNDQDLLDTNLNKFRYMLYLLVNNSVDLETVPSDGPMNRIFDFCADFKHTSWCTFNWDRVLETAFFSHRKAHHKGTLNLRKDENITIENYWENVSDCNLLLKLHGSIYWWYRQKSLHQLKYVGWGSTDGTHANEWEKFEDVVKQPNLSVSIGVPAILEPSAHKYQGEIHKKLQPQWDRFEEELQNADTVLVIGYSYPENDSKMPVSPIKNALEKVNENAKVVIIDPDGTGMVRARYEEVFKNKNLQFIEDKYDSKNIVEEIEKKLNCKKG